MKALLANPLELASLSEKDKGALVRLLSDPDPEVFQAIRQTLVNCGIEARPWLKAGLQAFMGTTHATGTMCGGP